MIKKKTILQNKEQSTPKFVLLGDLLNTVQTGQFNPKK